MAKAKQIETKKSKIKQSETIIKKRSQINFAPYNPKKHTKESIEQQRKNFKTVGFLGGIVWNRTTSNLISGHKRIMAYDLEYKYDGTEKTDYEVKVEAIELTEKQEREQNIYMDAKRTNTPQDYELLAVILPDIDIANTGLTDYDIQLIETVVPNFTMGSNEDIISDLQDLKQDNEERKANMKKLKKDIKNGVADNQTPSYFTVTFKNYQDKAEFLEGYGINGDAVFITGESFVDKINEQ
jgi:hypothetical protein